MKRFGALLAIGFLTFVVSGCSSAGIDEKPPEGLTPESSQPAAFKAEMQKNAGKMGVMKKQERPKVPPAAKTE